MNLTKLATKPRVFERLIGLSPQAFFALAAELEPAWEKAEYRRKTRRKRLRAVGGGNRYALSFPLMLAMHCLYLRTYTSHLFLGMLFGIDDSRVCRYFAKLEPVLSARMRKTITIERLPLAEAEVLKLIVDATEQETERRPGSGYSGKKKRQTIKTQVVVDARRRVRHISASVPGNIHDKRLYDETGLRLPPSALGDLGYMGVPISIPHKSSKLHRLTKREKRDNHAHATKRIVVEHVFAALKQFRILAHRFRNGLSRYHQTFVIVAGLYNVRLA
jgi:hypothetical protein